MFILKELRIFFAIIFTSKDIRYTRKKLENNISSISTNPASYKRYEVMLGKLIDNAEKSMKNIQERRNKEILMWRTAVPGILIAWYKLSFDVSITEDKIIYIYILKYILLFIGIIMTWGFIKALYLKSQHYSFGRDCSIVGDKLLEQNISFRIFEKKIFYNNNGLTNYFSSVTKQHIRQMFLAIFLFFILILLSIHMDWEFFLCYF